MKKISISHYLRIPTILLCLAVIPLLPACQEEDFDIEGKMDFSLLFDCMWRPEPLEHVPETDEIPAVALNKDFPFYFIENEEETKLEVLHDSGGQYRPYITYDARINKSTKIITLSAPGQRTYVAHITILSPHTLTVYFGSDENNSVMFGREELPPELSLEH